VSTPPRYPSNLPESSPRGVLREDRSKSNARTPPTPEPENVASTSTLSPPSPTSPGSERGRRRSRFSLSSVSTILMDAVRPASQKRGDFRASLERPLTLGRDRERSVDYGPRASSDMTRGRTMERGVGSTIPEGWLNEEPQASAEEQVQTRPWRQESGSRIRQSRERSRGVLGRILKEKEKEKEKGSKDKVEGWKEFKKGHFSFGCLFVYRYSFLFVFRNIYISNIFQYTIECSSIHAV
jgi:hypothetical protein